MRLESIDLQGVLRFRERVCLPLTDVSGLVAIVGENGAGKTSLLEAVPASLYRALPSRDHELVDYAHDRDSHIQTRFALGNRQFRARVALDGVHRKSEAVLLEQQPDGTELPLNDGKVSTFDAVVKATLPPQSVLLASAFAAQNRRGSFITLDRRGRRDLFSELIGLGHYDAMAQTCRAAASEIEQGRTRLAGRLEAVRAVCSDAIAADLRRRQIAEDEHLGAIRHRAQDIAQAMTGLQEAHEAAADAARAHTTALQRQQAAQTTVRDIARETAVVEAQQEAARDRQREDLAQIAGDRDRVREVLAEQLVDINTTAAAEMKDRQERIDRNREVIARGDAIRRAQQDVARLEQEIAALTKQSQEDRASLREQGQARETLRRQVAELERVEASLERDRQTATLLASAKCGGAGEYASCVLLTEAKAAAERIPGLADRIAGLATLRAGVAELDQQITDRQGAERTQGATLTRLQAELAGARDRAKESDRLAAAEARIAEHQAAIAALPAAVDKQRADAQAHAAARLADLDARTIEVDNRAFTALDAHATTLRTLAARLIAAQQDAAEADAAVTPLAGAPARLSQVVHALEDARQEQTAVAAQIARLEERVAALDRERQLLERRREELTALETSVLVLDAELVDWQTLAKALGREGLPTLEIDAAGPTVSADCNDLMLACFGGRFSLDLVTQEAKAGGKGMRESFELKVLDNERGGTARDVSDLSGGEQVIVDECLKAALSIWNNRRSQTPMRTCWRDETTGALDPENADRYIRMLRRMAQLAGFELVLFVTHSADCAAQADAQIRVHDGTAEIVHAPFDRQEAA